MKYCNSVDEMTKAGLQDGVLEIEDLKALRPLAENLDDRTVLSVSLEGRVVSNGQKTEQ